METTGPMSVIILGADGYLGWPMCLHLSRLGHQVVAVDNLARRQWDVEGGSYSLVPIASMDQRVARWRAGTGLEIDWRPMDICDGEALTRLFLEVRPEAVVHFAEHRSAPFSMIDQEHAVRTQVNNVVGRLNVMLAIKQAVPDCHRTAMDTQTPTGKPTRVGVAAAAPPRRADAGKVGQPSSGAGRGLQAERRLISARKLVTGRVPSARASDTPGFVARKSKPGSG